MQIRVSAAILGLSLFLFPFFHLSHMPRSRVVLGYPNDSHGVLQRFLLLLLLLLWRRRHDLLGLEE